MNQKFKEPKVQYPIRAKTIILELRITKPRRPNMHYLFETEHFLLRRRVPGDICRLPKAFPESGTSDALIIVFRSTGAPAGEVMIKNSPKNPDTPEVLCHLYEDFQRDGFPEEIVNAMSDFICNPDSSL